jgi:hypothetical protein
VVDLLDPSRPSSAQHQNSPTKKFLLVERWTSPRRSRSRNSAQACRVACCDTALPKGPTPAVPQVLNTKTLQQKIFCLSSAGPAQDVLVLTSQCKRVAQRAVTQPVVDLLDPSRPSSAQHQNSPTKKFLLVERWTSPRRSGSHNSAQACRAACCDTVWSTCSTPAVPQVLNTKTPQQKNFCLSSAGPAQDVLVLASQCKRVAQRAVTQCGRLARPQPSLKCSTPKLPNKKIFACRALDQPKTFWFSQPAQACRAVCCDTVWSTCSTPAVPQVLNTKTPQQKNFCLSSAGPAQDVLVLATRRKRVAQCAVTQCGRLARPQPSLKCSTPKLPNKKIFACRALDQPKTFWFSQPSASVSRSML